jgi:hypothetical protein
MKINFENAKIIESFGFRVSGSKFHVAGSRIPQIIF